MPDLDGAVVTADALHLHEETVAQVVEDKGGHMLINLKGNQETLLDEVKDAFETTDPRRIARDRDVDGGHGRIETRIAELIPLQTRTKHSHMKTAVRIHRTRIKKKTGAVSEETAYLVGTFTPDTFTAAEVQVFARGHWTVENRIHHRKDRTMQEDRCQARANVGSNLGLLRSVVLLIKDKAKQTCPRISGKLKGNAGAAIELVMQAIDNQ